MVDHAAALPQDTRLMVLAPVVTGRKGEQAELLEELRAQGFTRVRIDGSVHELDAAPRLAKNSKHTIEVVIDRLRARADAKQRLAESFETALRHADGRALVVSRRGPGLADEGGRGVLPAAGGFLRIGSASLHVRCPDRHASDVLAAPGESPHRAPGTTISAMAPTSL